MTNGSRQTKTREMAKDYLARAGHRPHVRPGAFIHSGCKRPNSPIYPTIPCQSKAGRNKAGAPFQYAGSPFATLAVVKSMTGLPYRHLQKETLGDWDAPCYTTIYRRFQSLEVKRNGNVFTITGGGTIRVRLAATLPALSSTTGRVDQAQVDDLGGGSSNST